MYPKPLFLSLFCLVVLGAAALPTAQAAEEEFVEERRLRLWSAQTFDLFAHPSHGRNGTWLMGV
jgi:hypothetical protein